MEGREQTEALFSALARQGLVQAATGETSFHSRHAGSRTRQDRISRVESHFAARVFFALPQTTTTKSPINNLPNCPLAGQRRRGGGRRKESVSRRQYADGEAAARKQKEDQRGRKGRGTRSARPCPRPRLCQPVPAQLVASGPRRARLPVTRTEGGIVPANEKKKMCAKVEMRSYISSSSTAASDVWPAR